MPENSSLMLISLSRARRIKLKKSDIGKPSGGLGAIKEAERS